jgi:hypothetical protein
MKTYGRKDAGVNSRSHCKVASLLLIIIKFQINALFQNMQENKQKTKLKQQRKTTNKQTNKKQMTHQKQDFLLPDRIFWQEKEHINKENIGFWCFV